MKYNTFKILRLGIVVCLSIGITAIIVLLFTNEKEITENTRLESESQRYMNNKEINKPEGGLSEIDKTIISLQKTNIEKNIDKTGKNYKLYKKFSYFIVDMRCDFTKGFSYWNRIKVDLDKDKNYDEKWTINEKGIIRKFISTNDNGIYNEEYELIDDHWVQTNTLP